LSNRNMIGFKSTAPSNTSSKAAWQRIQAETPPPAGTRPPLT
jgi:hypothetical protein